ncbi:hypothetical protein C4579_04540 [Candidatus Microgenomates bacterium]|nr:MAG: hypothetical protein C4579_04540 [Candidatus Microgenomates bacterium]
MFRPTEYASSTTVFQPGNHGTTSIIYGENDTRNDQLARVLDAGWNLNPSSLDSIKVGESVLRTVWRVQTAADLFVLKRLDMSSAKAEIITNCWEYCRSHSVPLPQIVTTNQKKLFHMEQSDAYVLMRYIAGEHYDGSSSQLEQAAQALAYFHQTIATCNYDHAPLQRRFYAAHHDPEKLVSLQALIKKQPPRNDFETNVQDMLEELGEWSRDVGTVDLLKLPMQFTHGDIHPHNLLFSKRNGQLTAFLDLNSLDFLQRVRDVAFAMHRLSRTYGIYTERQKDVGIDIRTRAQRFLTAYIGVNRLTEDEIKAIPFILADEALQRIMILLTLHYEEANTIADHDLQKQLDTLHETRLFLNI